MAIVSGERFGMLETVEPVAFRAGKKDVIWLCRCDCGDTTRVVASNLRSGNTKSCGCSKGAMCRATAVRHGLTGTKEHQAWSGMKKRCYRKQCKSYPDYGGRGITVCDRWFGSFEAFLEDMGPAPSRSHTIERVNNDGNYEPGNCIWATRLVQSRNRRMARMLTWDGRTQNLSAWAKELGIKSATITKRIELGWSMEEVMTMPVTSANKYWRPKPQPAA